MYNQLMPHQLTILTAPNKFCELKLLNRIWELMGLLRRVFTPLLKADQSDFGGEYRPKTL